MPLASRQTPAMTWMISRSADAHLLGIDTSWGRSFTDGFVARAILLLAVWIEGKGSSSCFLQNKPVQIRIDDPRTL
jgi:hypothetical protein